MTPELIQKIIRELETALANAGDYGSVSLVVNKRGGHIDRLVIKTEKSVMTGEVQNA